MPSRIETTGVDVAQLTNNSTRLTIIISEIQKQQTSYDSGKDPIVNLSLDEVCRCFGLPYNPFVELRSRMITIQLPNNEKQQHISKFRMLLCKGPDQFNDGISKYKTDQNEYGAMILDESATFDSLIINHYTSVFKSPDKKDIERLKNEKDVWHMVFFGVRNNPTASRPSRPAPYVLDIIAVLSFKVLPCVPNAVMVVKWFAITNNKALAADWGVKGAQRNKQLFFDNKQFTFKGIGSSMLCYMQRFGEYISRTFSSYGEKPCQVVFCESSQDALPFYLYGMGFQCLKKRHVDNLPDIVKTEFIGAETLVPVVFKGLFSDARPKNVHGKGEINLAKIRSR